MKKIEVYCAMYRMTVVVVYDTTKKEIIALAKEHRIKTRNTVWVRDLDSLFITSINGFCMNFGDHNDDVLIWLRKRPETAYDYGTLYHEIYHAVQNIISTRKLTDECESPAYLYEYIATACNKELWNKKR